MTNVSGKIENTKTYYPIIYTYFKNTGFSIKYDAKIPSFNDILEANRIQLNISKTTSSNNQSQSKTTEKKTHYAAVCSCGQKLTNYEHGHVNSKDADFDVSSWNAQKKSCSKCGLIGSAHTSEWSK